MHIPTHAQSLVRCDALSEKRPETNPRASALQLLTQDPVPVDCVKRVEYSAKLGNLFESIVYRLMMRTVHRECEWMKHYATMMEWKDS